jgi:hypothetical protein
MSFAGRFFGIAPFVLLRPAPLAAGRAAGTERLGDSFRSAATLLRPAPLPDEIGRARWISTLRIVYSPIHLTIVRSRVVATDLATDLACASAYP